MNESASDPQEVLRAHQVRRQARKPSGTSADLIKVLTSRGTPGTRGETGPRMFAGEMKLLSVLALSVLFCGAQICIADDSPWSRVYQKKLSQGPAAELPAAAADIVKKAKARDWGHTTVDVVKAATAINPAAAPAVVGAIARAVPEMAAVAAETAAGEQPKLASAIARAAAVAAPGKVAKIVAAVCRAVPNDYRAVALAVSEAVPGSGKEVLKGVAAAVPSIRPGIDKNLAAYNGNTAAFLDQVASANRNGTAPLTRGPSIGPPYVPYSGTVGTITPNTTTEVPPGHRYEQP